MNTNLKRSPEGRLLRLTLARPEKRNALNVALCRELVLAFREAEADDAVSVILVDAEGPAFCAGMDLDEALEPNATENTGIHTELFTLGARARKPIVAAVEGAALAGGTGLVANAHVVVAADDATFGLTEIRIGLWPYVVFSAISLAIGERRTVELGLTGRICGAAEALTWGLVHHVIPAAEVNARATGIARGISEASPEALRIGLDLVRRNRGKNPEEAAEIASGLRAENFRHPDFAEGVRAFREKRKPRWT